MTLRSAGGSTDAQPICGARIDRHRGDSVCQTRTPRVSPRRTDAVNLPLGSIAQLSTRPAAPNRWERPLRSPRRIADPLGAKPAAFSSSHLGRRPVPTRRQPHPEAGVDILPGDPGRRRRPDLKPGVDPPRIVDADPRRPSEEPGVDLADRTARPSRDSPLVRRPRWRTDRRRRPQGQSRRVDRSRRRHLPDNRESNQGRIRQRGGRPPPPPSSALPPFGSSHRVPPPARHRSSRRPTPPGGKTPTRRGEFLRWGWRAATLHLSAAGTR